MTHFKKLILAAVGALLLLSQTLVASASTSNPLNKLDDYCYTTEHITCGGGQKHCGIYHCYLECHCKSPKPHGLSFKIKYDNHFDGYQMTLL